MLGGGGLWVAFPHAYAVIMPAFYLPVIVMLLALVFRGVAFEFRWICRESKPSVLEFRLRRRLDAGGLLPGRHPRRPGDQGIRVENGVFAGGPLRFRHAVRGAVRPRGRAGYALLGATWLVMKTDGAVADTRARRRRNGC